MLEEFARSHEHTIALVEAVSTFCAVVVSLWLAFFTHRSKRTKVTANVGVSFISHPSLKGNPEYIVVSITNERNFPATIGMSFFTWKLPFWSGFWLVMPLDGFKRDPL